jgi:hypothetical protein
VVDGSDAGFGGVAGAGLAGTVDADARARAVGLGDGGSELFLTVLVGRGELRVRAWKAGEAVASGLVDLGEVGALFALGSHYLDELGGVIGAVGVGEQMLFGVVAGRVFMAAVDVDGVAGDAHAGAGDEAGVDGVADGDVGAEGALGAHVALGGEAGEEVGFGLRGGDEGALRDGFHDGLEGLVAGVQEEVNVSVDEAGHQGGRAEVDDGGVRGMRDVLADFGDLVAGDEDFAGRDELAGGDVEEMRGVEDCGRGGWSGFGLRALGGGS